MYTRIANKKFYDNFKMGCAKPEEVGAESGGKTVVFLTFHDQDNDESHLFQIDVNVIEQFFNLVRQTAAGTKIEIVGKMPDGLKDHGPGA